MLTATHNKCPLCGSDVLNSVICTIPPIQAQDCPMCGWHWEENRITEAEVKEYNENRPIPAITTWRLFNIERPNTYPPEREEVIISVMDTSTHLPYCYTTSGWFLNKTWIVNNRVLKGKVLTWAKFPDPIIEEDL